MVRMSGWRVPEGFTRRECLVLAAESDVDFRSITKALAGGHVRGTAGVRIRAVLRRYGIVAAKAPEPQPPTQGGQP